MRKQQGFTLIELMIVIAILGILLAIAIPAYQDYAIRARVSEGIMALAPAKLAVSEFRLSEGTFPTTRADAGFGEVVTDIVESVDMNGTIVIVDYTEGAGGLGIDASEFAGDVQISMTPGFSGNAVTWNCTYTGTAGGEQYVPSSCRN